MEEKIIHKIIDFTDATTTQNTFGVLAILGGAIVGAVKKISTNGWKGWAQFGMLLVINVFVGTVAYLIAKDMNLNGLKPIIIALIFGSLGEKGGEFIVANFLGFIKFKYDTSNNNKK